MAWDESSHLGRRPICFVCIGLRDTEKMRRKCSIVLYHQDNRLVNLTKTLFLKIKEKQIFSNYTLFIFLFEGRRWHGVQYNGVERVSCRVAK